MVLRIHYVCASRNLARILNTCQPGLTICCIRFQHFSWIHSLVQSSAKKPRQIAKFCSSCGGKIELAVPGDETEWRHVCMDCHAITYYNPKMVGSLLHAPSTIYGHDNERNHTKAPDQALPLPSIAFLYSLTFLRYGASNSLPCVKRASIVMMQSVAKAAEAWCHERLKWRQLMELFSR